MNDEDKLKESVKLIEEPDLEKINDLYQSKNIYKNLALTRETIRYYEQIGLLHIEKDQGNQYRSFNVEDIQVLLIIDSYKKKGFSASEIKEIMEKDNLDQIKSFYLQKIANMKETIEIYQRYVSQMNDDLTFISNVESHVNQYSIREFPLYRVKDTLKAFTAFQEYQNHVINQIDTKNEAILDSLVRVVCVNNTHYMDSKVCVVELANTIREDETYLMSGKCIYTIVEVREDEVNTMERMFKLVTGWLKDKNIETQGFVYIRPKFYMNKNQEKIAYSEAWMPIVKTRT